jgi:GAF domain-containing protein
MSFNISLNNRLIAGITLLSVIIIFFLVYLTRQINDKDHLTNIISEDFQPSITALTELTDKYKETKNLVIYWGNAGISGDIAFRNNLENVFQTDINAILEILTVLSVKWNPEDLDLFKSTSTMIRDSLFYSYLNLISEFRTSQAENNESLGINDFIEQQDILFLLSEIEQNLSYLLDKRRIDMNTNFQFIQKSALGIRKTLIWFTILIISIIVAFSIWTFMFIRKSVNKLNSNLNSLTQGIIPPQIENISTDEMGTVYGQMNRLFAYLKNLTFVSQKINQKEFNSEFKPLSEKDELGIALLNLQNNLKQASEEEFRRKKEDDERRWTAEGIAKINDILRISSEKLEDLAFNLIREISLFTSAQVGALYIINDSVKKEIYAEMIAAFAYDRQKFINKKINIGEGLVGRCIQENETVYLTEIPENYLSVKSGLGESKPVSILIVPLHLAENVYGVIELASFSKFEPYKIHFIETIGENIATSISKVKINLQTTLLLEQTRLQAEEMATQEEEMRQNMEALRSMQELSAVREEKLLSEIEMLKQKVKSSENT